MEIPRTDGSNIASSKSSYSLITIITIIITTAITGIATTIIPIITITEIITTTITMGTIVIQRAVSVAQDKLTSPFKKTETRFQIKYPKPLTARFHKTETASN